MRGGEDLILIDQIIIAYSIIALLGNLLPGREDDIFMALCVALGISIHGVCLIKASVYVPNAEKTGPNELSCNKARA